MYTFEDYESDLSVYGSLGLTPARNDTGNYISYELHCAVEREYVTEYYDGRSIHHGTGRTNERNTERGKIKGNNFQYLKRSDFNTKKFRSTLKSEGSMGPEDDFSSLFISLWTQMEYEYRRRLYDRFIPEKMEDIMGILRGAGQIKDNCFETVVTRKKEVTFGLVNEVIYAIEKGFKQGDKKISFMLSKIFNSSYLKFFKNYSINSSFAKLNREIRNEIMHENKFLDHERYSEVCKVLFNTRLINDWSNSEKSCFFTDYLKMLPESDEEKNIFLMEKTIKQIKMSPGIKPGKEQLAQLELELEAKKKWLLMI